MSANTTTALCAECRRPIMDVTHHPYHTDTRSIVLLLSCGCAAHSGCWERRRRDCASYGVLEIRCGVCWRVVCGAAATMNDRKRKRATNDSDA